MKKIIAIIFSILFFVFSSNQITEDAFTLPEYAPVSVSETEIISIPSTNAVSVQTDEQKPVSISISNPAPQPVQDVVKIKVITPYGTILESEQNFEDSLTVFELTKAVLDNAQIQFDFSGSEKSAYIKGINGLYEKDMGQNSGWLYFVNGELAHCGCGQYKLKPDDQVTWHYYENCFEKNLTP